MRYPSAIWRGTPKHGYGNDDNCLGLGIVAHSMEGGLQAAFGELGRPDRQASWHFSVAKNGDVYQHIETENISYASGSYEANRRFWSIEHEGRAGEPLEPPQRIATTALMGWLLGIKGSAPVRGTTLREHREMVEFGAAATACPSNRIPWNTIIPALQPEEDDMDVQDKQTADAIRIQLENLNKGLDPVKLGFESLLGEIVRIRELVEAHNAGGPHAHEATVTLQ